MKKVGLKRLHTIWFHLYNILEKQNYRDGEKISGCQVLGKRGLDYKEMHKEMFSVTRTILYPVCSGGYKHFCLC